MVTSKDILEIIYNKRTGNIITLSETIGKEEVEGLKLVGYIKTGLTGSEWSITKFGCDTYEAVYGDLKASDKILGYFGHYILGW